MTLTFENDNDIIIYALEKIISFARSNQYIFLAQSVWWISSIIGLQQGLVTHIDNLQCLHSSMDEPWSEDVSGVPRDLPDGAQNNLDFQGVLPGRISQVDKRVDTESLDKIPKVSEESVKQSLFERKRFDPLRRTRQGKVQPRKLAEKEWRRLNTIIPESPDLVRKFIQ
jgi:hypothetical protein